MTSHRAAPVSTSINMRFRMFVDRLSSRAHGGWVLTAGILVLAGLYLFPELARRRIQDERRFQNDLSKTLEQTITIRDRLHSLATLKAADLDQLKSGLGGHALSEKALYESGL